MMSVLIHYFFGAFLRKHLIQQPASDVALYRACAILSSLTHSGARSF